tara:strand:+ start:1196 stop:1357 length:162 start_codon:yes stop_codon:yes gene_type:complete
MHKSAQTSVHIIVGILVIMGGISYLINQGGLGLVFISIGLLVEAVVNWVGKII